MKFAVLADIHGNSFALQAVLADMHDLGVTMAVNLGDVFSGPLDARGTAALLLDRGFATVRGNHDRNLLQQDPANMGPSDRCAFDQLDPAHFDWLRSLPETLTVFGDVFLCHGTPTNDSRYWLEKVAVDGTVEEAPRHEILEQAEGLEASLILCAHSHIPRFLSLPDGRSILNPGSVGCPAYDDDTPVYHVVQTGTPDASYAIAERQASGWTLAFRTIRYDAARASALAIRNGRPDWGRALATGHLR